MFSNSELFLITAFQGIRPISMPRDLQERLTFWYGCEVKETEDWYALEPRDGLGVRAFFQPVDVHLETVRATIESVAIRKDKSRVAIECRRPYPHADSGWVRLRGMPAGKYAIRAGDGEQALSTDDGTLEAPLGREATEVQVWRI